MRAACLLLLPSVIQAGIMKQILVLGAGKSATTLIEYLLSMSDKADFTLHVADIDRQLADKKTGGHPRSVTHGLHPSDPDAMDSLVSGADLVISLLPPHLHTLAAVKCLAHRKHFLNASYVNAEMEALDTDAKALGLTFLCEMGLDPGIDHMSAMEMIHRIQAEQGVITSFRSHCGGLIAPESDDNPWHYKISWNPRNIVMAGKDGASWLDQGKPVRTEYADLFDSGRQVEVPGLGKFAWYPNRDSLSYIPKYGLQDISTFVRTTLRHPDFCFGWKNIVELRLTDETPQYDTDGMTLSAFFQIHFDRYGFSEWLQRTLSTRFSHTKSSLDNLIRIMEEEKARMRDENRSSEDFLLVNEKGELMGASFDKAKSSAAEHMATQMREANLSLTQLFYLGLDSDEMINRGKCSAADILQWILENKLALGPADKDMIVMLHEIGYLANGVQKESRSCLVVKGTDSLHTAMAKTVGLPLGIAALMILDGRLSRTGVCIPIYPDIYSPVLAELDKLGIRFIHY
jgi:saccharopine dehydrogenase-like NADP-dependent oxidoreductase